MKKTMTKLYTILILTLITSSPVFGDLQKLLHDTQKITQEGTTTNMVWWIPSEFWEESLRQNPQLTEEQKKEFIAALHDYTAFVIVNMKAGVFGGMTFKSREEILKNISLTVGDEEIKQIAIEDLSADARSFYTMMKPMMSQMLGQFGEGMEFIIYPNKRDGKLILDAESEGRFSYTSFGDKYDWRLPLGSVIPPKIDPETGEEFPGNYQYNPYTGNKLSKK